MFRLLGMEVSLGEVLRVFRLLEELNDLFHQELYYENPRIVRRFVRDHFRELDRLSTRVVWNWFPEDGRPPIPARKPPGEDR